MPPRRRRHADAIDTDSLVQPVTEPDPRYGCVSCPDGTTFQVLVDVVDEEGQLVLDDDGETVRALDGDATMAAAVAWMQAHPAADDPGPGSDPDS